MDEHDVEATVPAPAPSIRRDGLMALAYRTERSSSRLGSMVARIMRNRFKAMTGLALIGATRMSEAETLVILHALAR